MSSLIWAGTLGYLVFDAARFRTIAGAVIIAMSGFYTAYREGVRALQRKFSAE